MWIGERFPQIICAAQEGAEWAISLLYRDLHPAVLGYLRSQEPAEAEDLASETWIDVARGLRSFEGGESSFRAWIFTIARRRLIDSRRRISRRRTDCLPNEQLADLAATDDTENEALERAWAELAIARAFRTLTSDQAEVLRLRVIGGLNVDQVAEIIGKGPGAIRVIQHRALKRLARELSLEFVTN